MTRLRPGERAARVLLVLAVAAVSAAWLPGVVWLVAAGLGALAAAAGAEAAILARARVTAERAGRIALPLDEPEEIELAVAVQARRPLRLVVRQVWPPLLEPAASEERRPVRPGELARLRLAVRGVERGSAPLPPPHAALTVWGLVERRIALPLAGEVHVLPNLARVARLHRKLNRFALRGLGVRAAAKLGKGREFDRLRDYVEGDDLRDVAWKASARHRKLIVQEYRLDRSQDIVVCLDRGHRMAARVARVTRLDHAIDAALLLAYIANRMEDRIGLLAFAAEAEQGIAQGHGRSQLRRLTAYATGLAPEVVHTDYLALAAHLRRRLRHRTLVLVVTALPEREEQGELLRAVEVLTPQHLPLVVLFTDPELEAVARLRPASKEELSRTLVARDLWHGRQQMVRRLRRRGALVVETPPGDAGLDAVNAYLEVKRAQRL